MKKLLIATSALVATAGVAAAQVSVSGSARFGLQYVANVPAGTTSYIVSNRLRVNFAMSGTADNGVTFGAFTRLNIQQGLNVGNNVSASRVSGGHVFLAANGFRITVGNMGGAVAHRVALYGGGLGYTGSFGVGANFDGGGLVDNTGVGAVMVPTTHTAYSEQSNGGGGFTGVRVDADFGDFGASIGFVSLIGGGANPAGNSTTEVALSYAAGGFSAAIGGRFGNAAPANTNNNQTSVSLGYRMGDLAVGAVATQIANGALAGGTNWRLWGTYTTGPWTLRATATQINTTVGARPTGTAWGIGGSYNLGGGASASLAVGSNLSNNTVAELGVNMRF